MHRNTSVALAGAMLLVPGLANGADIGLPPLLHKAPPIVEEFGGWYLRGDIGFSSQSVDKVVFTDERGITPSQGTVTKDFDSAGIYKVGLGYRFNGWLRTDVTGEYRAGSTYKALSWSQYPASARIPETDFGTKSEWVMLANAYFDLGTWWCITPFVGAGVGASYNRIDNFVDINTLNNAQNGSDGAGEWNFAWALYAGLAYRATPNLTFELAYRYIDLGDAKTGVMYGYDGTVRGSKTFDHITSNDVTLGMRWQFGCADCAPPPPVVRKY